MQISLAANFDEELLERSASMPGARFASERRTARRSAREACAGWQAQPLVPRSTPSARRVER